MVFIRLSLVLVIQKQPSHNFILFKAKCHFIKGIHGFPFYLASQYKIMESIVNFYPALLTTGTKGSALSKSSIHSFLISEVNFPPVNCVSKRISILAAISLLRFS